VLNGQFRRAGSATAVLTRHVVSLVQSASAEVELRLRHLVVTSQQDDFWDSESNMRRSKSLISTQRLQLAPVLPCEGLVAFVIDDAGFGLSILVGTEEHDDRSLKRHSADWRPSFVEN